MPELERGKDILSVLPHLRPGERGILLRIIEAAEAREARQEAQRLGRRALGQPISLAHSSAYAILRDEPYSLTSREVEVLECIVNGMTNKEAGALLSISHRTVEAHRARVCDKLCANNVSELVRIALDLTQQRSVA